MTFPHYDDQSQNRFHKVTEFSNDVYVHGKLYADLVGGLSGDGGSLTVDQLIVDNSATFNGDVRVNAELDADYLTVRHRLNVGVGGTVVTIISKPKSPDDEQFGPRVGIGSTQPDALLQVGEKLTSFVVTEDGSVGIGTTQPRVQFESKGLSWLGNKCLTVTVDPCRVGIGSTLPQTKFQVNDTEDTTFVVTNAGSVGIGSLDPTAIPLYNSSQEGVIKLNVDGTIKIDRNIIDSANSPGVNGYYLNRDANGIRWIQASPIDQDGMYAQDEGVYLPTNGTSQLFSVFNYKQINSLGIGVDTLIPIPNPSNPTMICDVQTQDLWGHVNSNNDSPIYRMTKVGVQNNNPSYDLDITGTLHATENVKFDAQLEVDGDTFLNAKLDVDDDTTLNSTLDVDGATTLNDTLDVDGATTLNNTLDVDGLTTFNESTDASSPTNASVQMDGGLGVVKKVHIGDKLTVDSGLQSTDKDSGSIVTEGGVGIEKNLNVGQNAKIFGSLELESALIDYHNLVPSNSTGKNDWRLSSIGVGVSWRPSGIETENIIYVTRDGNDNNSGLLEGDAVRTIGKAAEIAQEGDTIKVRSGVYNENNPIGLRTDVTISGEDLRLVTVVPNNPTKDFFHVRAGCLIQNLNFAGSSHATSHVGCGAVAFPPIQASITAGTDFQAVTGYTELGPANEGERGRWRSPYVRNCTNFMTGSIGMKINGDHADANFTGTNNLGQDIKSMVCDSFTQYNEQGIGVSITNNAYAQLVSIFTIGCDIGISCSTGGQCDLTNSNSSFGNFGLVADGVGDIEFTGTTNTAINGESDAVIIDQIKDVANNYRTPFDGQGAYFHLDMSDYSDTASTVQITKPMELIRSVKVTNAGSPGDYSPSSPPIVTASLPEGPEAIFAEFSPNIAADGTIESIDVIASGRNFLPTQTVTINISGGGSATAEANMDPILFTVSDSTDSANSGTGTGTVTFNEFIPYAVKNGVTVEFVRLSRIITSSHSFEYIGAGTDLNTANPFQGGKPIPENEVVAINGGQCPFTSTDQKGNFRIGDGLTIDQTTSTIRGRDFNRAIQAQLTPLILALK